MNLYLPVDRQDVGDIPDEGILESSTLVEDYERCKDEELISEIERREVTANESTGH